MALRGRRTNKNAPDGTFLSVLLPAATYSPTPVSRAALFLHARCRARSGGSAADGTARETVWRSAAAVQTKTPRGRFCLYYCRQRPTLPHSFPCSTIGGIRLNFRVRNGNGCDPDPMTTGMLAAWGFPPSLAARAPEGRPHVAACPPQRRLEPLARRWESSQTIFSKSDGQSASAHGALRRDKLNILQTVV